MSKFTLEDAISIRRSHREFDDRPVALPTLLKLLSAAQGITDPSGKRTVASAHALNPLGIYVTANRVTELSEAIYLVSSDASSLSLHVEREVRFDLQRAALEDQPWISAAACIVSICADMVAASKAFLDQPPYGLRGRRYAYIEAGAAAQNIQLLSISENLGSVLVAGFRDEATAGALQLPSSVEPILHLCIGWPAPN